MTHSLSVLHKRKKRVSYKTWLVTYFDILGFRSLLKSETAGRISRILRVVKESSRRDKESERDFERLCESFADLTLRSIVVSSIEFLRDRSALLFYELESIAKVQIEVIQLENILVRGGLQLDRSSRVGGWSMVMRSSKLTNWRRRPRIREFLYIPNSSKYLRNFQVKIMDFR